ncbi:MAG: PIN domain-containing protein [Deltaproteobacteria bacterium]|nr:PIN domain-containing protein [Deltaproteobacteria bacterium]
MEEEYYYLDTSAYLGILLGEEKADLIRNFLQEKKLCSNVLMFIEAERNLVLMSREKDMSSNFYESCSQRLHQDVESFVLKDLSLDLALNRVYPPLKTPRTLDLIHLRTALWFQQNYELKAFVTLDRHQEAAAVELNLPLLKE